MGGLLVLWPAMYLIEAVQFPQPLCSKYYSPWYLSTLTFSLSLDYGALIDPKNILERPRRKRSIESEELQAIFRQIKVAVVNRKLYLNPDVNQADLSRLLLVQEYL